MPTCVFSPLPHLISHYLIPPFLPHAVVWLLAGWMLPTAAHSLAHSLAGSLDNSLILFPFPSYCFLFPEVNPQELVAWAIPLPRAPNKSFARRHTRVLPREPDKSFARWSLPSGNGLRRLAYRRKRKQATEKGRSGVLLLLLILAAPQTDDSPRSSNLTPPSHPLTSFSARLERDGRSRPRQSSGPRRRGARPHTVARIDIIKSFGHSGVKRLRTDDAAHRDSAAAIAVAAAPPLLCARLHEVS